MCLQVLPDQSTLEAVNGDQVANVDAVVFATGFDTKAPLAQFDITASGLNLGQVVASKPEAYLGTAIAGFPNLFTMLGFNTGQCSSQCSNDWTGISFFMPVNPAVWMYACLC